MRSAKWLKVEDSDQNVSKCVDTLSDFLDNLPACCKLEGGIYFIDSIGITVSGKLVYREAKEVAKKLHSAKPKRINGERL